MSLCLHLSVSAEKKNTRLPNPGSYMSITATFVKKSVLLFPDSLLQFRMVGKMSLNIFPVLELIIGSRPCTFKLTEGMQIANDQNRYSSHAKTNMPTGHANQERFCSVLFYINGTKCLFALFVPSFNAQNGKNQNRAGSGTITTAKNERW